MPNFDFHSNLSSDDFERFVRDVLEIRELPLTFRTYRRGPDGGIDFRCTNSTIKIIGQTKLYKDDYKQLKSSLLNELAKVKKRQPARYILATSVSLSPDQVEEIFDLFNGFIINREDIIDKEQLNKYLGQKEYHCLIKTYSKLLIPDWNILDSFLDNTINRDIQNRTRREIIEIEKHRKVFVQTKAFDAALEQLLKNRVLIVSGNPGIGKTTLAHMLLNYFRATNQADFVYIKSMDEFDKCFKHDREQLFLWDDFWGQNIDETKNIREHSTNYYRDFTRCIEDVSKSDNHWLIITSRDYIIKSVCSSNDKTLRTNIDLNKFLLQINSYDLRERLRILLNHLYFSDYEKEYFINLEYQERELERIIRHTNYTPRQIDFFLKFVYTEDKRKIHWTSSHMLLNDLINYLDNPSDYWREIFEKQNCSERLILFILLISSDPMTVEALRLSFSAYQLKVRQILNWQIEPLKLIESLNNLEELFIRSEALAYSNDRLIYFQSPGIKDFLLEYLRINKDIYAEIFISEAIFFNQLYFVFTTESEDDDVDDTDSNFTVNGSKIFLNRHIQNILKKKVIAEFHQLQFGNYESREYTGELCQFDEARDTKYWKLWLFSRWFNIADAENNDVKNFIIREVQNDIEAYNNKETTKGKIVGSKSMDTFPKLIKLCSDHIEFDRENIISAFYHSITFTREFSDFFQFQDIFSVEFESFLSQNIKSIRKDIRETILDDIDYFLWNADDIELDTLVSYSIDDVFKSYKLKMTTKFQKEMEAASDYSIEFSRKKKKRKRSINRSKKKDLSIRPFRYGPPKFENIIKEYTGERADFEALNYLKKICKNKDRLNKLVQLFDSEDELTKCFFENIQSVDFLNNSIDEFESNKNVWTHLIDKLITSSVPNNLNEKVIFDALGKIAFETYFTDSKSTTKSNIETILIGDKINFDDISSLNPILIKRGNWYEFLNISVLYHFFSYYVFTHMDDQQYLEVLGSLAEESCDGHHELISLIKELDVEKFIQLFVLPIVGQFISAVNAESDRDILNKYLDFFGIDFSLSWDKKRKALDVDSSSGGEMVTEFVLKHITGNVDITGLDTFFCKDYIYGENIKKYQINPIALNNLYDRVLKTCKPVKKRRILDYSEYECFNINLKDFIKNDDNYLAMQEIGMERYVLNNISLIEAYFSTYLTN